MPFQACWRCLSRIPTRNLPFYSIIPQHSAAFNTLRGIEHKKHFDQKNAGGKSSPPKRGTRNFRPKKTRVTTEKGRRPLPGERKSMRKRIVLSNSNALVIEGMQDISAESIVDAQLQGLVLGIPRPLIERLLAVEAFKPTQGWSLFRRPGTLIRKETVQYGKLFEEMSKDGEKQSLRRVLVGEKGSGKTVMLLQAMAMAFLKDWVVINIPDGTNPIAYYLPSASEKVPLRRAFLTKAQPKRL